MGSGNDKVLHNAVFLISPHLFSQTSILFFRGLHRFPMLEDAVCRLSQKNLATVKSKSHS